MKSRKKAVSGGELLVIDTQEGRILHTRETDNDLKTRHPYKAWLEKNVVRLTPYQDLMNKTPPQRAFGDAQLAVYQKQFGYTRKSWSRFCGCWGKRPEAVGSMGMIPRLRYSLPVRA